MSLGRKAAAEAPPVLQARTLKSTAQASAHESEQRQWGLAHARARRLTGQPRLTLISTFVGRVALDSMGIDRCLGVCCCTGRACKDGICESAPCALPCPIDRPWTDSPSMDQPPSWLATGASPSTYLHVLVQPPRTRPQRHPQESVPRGPRRGICPTRLPVASPVTLAFRDELDERGIINDAGSKP